MRIQFPPKTLSPDITVKYMFAVSEMDRKGDRIIVMGNNFYAKEGVEMQANGFETLPVRERFANTIRMVGTTIVLILFTIALGSSVINFKNSFSWYFLSAANVGLLIYMGVMLKTQFDAFMYGGMKNTANGVLVYFQSSEERKLFQDILLQQEPVQEGKEEKRYEEQT